MKRFGLIVLVFLFVAATQAANSSAGTDFYFTVLDFGISHVYEYDGMEVSYDEEDEHKRVILQVTSSAATDITVTAGGRELLHDHFNNLALLSFNDIRPLEPIHVTTSAPCYLYAGVVGETNSAETAILPTDRLGTDYMIQTALGSLISSEKTYGAFVVVGTEDNTTVTVKGKKSKSFSLYKGGVLHFQSEDHTEDISGSTIHSNKPVAVFQGNTLTCIPPSFDDDGNFVGFDYTWEQARPTNAWGKEFIIPQSSKLQRSMYKITALNDNTEIYSYTNGTKQYIKTINAGESYGMIMIEETASKLAAHHIECSKPACCYLYCTNHSINNGVGDPAMTEIMPIDRPATATMWTLSQAAENAPYQMMAIVTIKAGNEDYITLNGAKIGIYTMREGGTSINTDGYITYEIPHREAKTMTLKAEKGGFSAYVLKLGTISEAAAFNLSIPMPIVIVSTPRACEGDIAVLTGEFTNDGSITEPVSFQWYFSSDNSIWHPISGATELEWRTDKPADKSYEGWYKLVVTGSDANSPYNIAESAPAMLTLEDCDPQRPDLCPDGVLLFREDFGGNDPNDPVAGLDPVPGMSDQYVQIFDTAMCNGCQHMGAGKYLLTKQGYRNASSATYSQWYIMDDHTYPGDYSRGYFLEVDGKGGKDAFYQTTIDNLCEGTKLTFSAYVANVEIPYEYLRLKKTYGYVYPMFTFIIKAPDTGQELKRYNTDTIGHDWRYYGVSDGWRHSAHWQHVGTTFIVPENVTKVELTIINNTANGIGNDFALDDIEVYACFPPVKLKADSVICKDSRNRFELNVDFKNNQSFVEPIVYQWFYAMDNSDQWTEIIGNWDSVYTPHFSDLKTGWYQVAVSGAGQTASKNCSAWSDPFHLRVDSNCVDLCENGVRIFKEDINANIPAYSTTLTDLCAGSDLTFVAIISNGDLPQDFKDHPWLTVYPELRFTLIDPATQAVLATYNTGKIPYKAANEEYGLKYTIPEDINAVTLQISNSTPQNAGINFAIQSVEIRHCMPPIEINGKKEACRRQSHIFYSKYPNDGSVINPEYQWSFSKDSIVWTVLQSGKEQTYLIPEVHKSHEGLYRIAVASDGQFDNTNCRIFSEPVRLRTTFCATPDVQHIDTTVCDTLIPVTWRKIEWKYPGTAMDTLRDMIDDDDSVYLHLALHTMQCCPDIMYILRDTAICDTLLPFTWIRDGRTFLFEKPEMQHVDFPHTKWTQCIGTMYQYTVDTFHCERKWPLIVNKYNWQLLLDYVALHRLFPERTPKAFQWYKDDEAVEGATEDDYCEHNELNGAYQLRLLLDDDEYIWSNIVYLKASPNTQPVIKRIYNSQGTQVSEEQMTQGVYFIRYMQGGNTWTEKRLVQ